MTGRQFGIFPSQPPNWIATEPSAPCFGVGSHYLLNPCFSFSIA
jgi:hypothetical protein